MTSPLKFQLNIDNEPALRLCVLFDVSSMRSQISRSIGIKRFNINFSLMLQFISEVLGPIINTQFFLFSHEPHMLPALNKLANYIKAIGANVEICSYTKTEFISQYDPRHESIIQQVTANGDFVEEINNGWLIHSHNIKNTSKVEMAAAIAEASLSNRYDCIVLGTNDAVFIPVVRKFILNRNLNCGIIFIQNEEQPTLDTRTISSDFINLFHYRLRFTDDILVVRDES
jgi:uncharacterized LabA/DUF88 family protein